MGIRCTRLWRHSLDGARSPVRGRVQVWHLLTSLPVIMAHRRCLTERSCPNTFDAGKCRCCG
eukprot:16438466-Heterocapsa_arctica.AAC.1